MGGFPQVAVTTDSSGTANFDVFIEDVHCQNVILAASGDGGYARLLEPLVDDEKKRNKITMVRGPPFVRELAELLEHFVFTSFEGVFSSKSSTKRRPSSPKTASATPPLNNVDIAKITAPLMLQSPINGISQPKQPYFRILRNKNGERVDQIVIHSPSIVDRLLHKRLCHAHHLLGQCNFSKCQHQSTHQLTINDDEWRALRNIARRTRCQRGLACSERNCVLGHQCLKDCLPGAGCRFSPSLHGVDVHVVSEV